MFDNSSKSVSVMFALENKFFKKMILSTFRVRRFSGKKAKINVSCREYSEEKELPHPSTLTLPIREG